MLFIALLAPFVSESPNVGTLADNLARSSWTDVTTVYGQIAPVCSVDTSNAQAVVDLTTRMEQTVSSVTYTCNAVDGFTRKIASANGGALRRGSQEIAYFISQSGDAPLAVSRVRLTAPITENIPSFPALTIGSSGFLRVDVPSIGRGLLAGEYRDTITIEITPN